MWHRAGPMRLAVTACRFRAARPHHLVAASSLWEYNTTVLRGARAEVEAWPEDLSGLDVTAGFSRIVSAASRPWPDPDNG